MIETATVALDALREQIDSIDLQLLELVNHRLETCARVAEHKRDHNITMMQQDRLDALQTKVSDFAEHHGIEKEFLRELFELITHETCRLEDAVIGTRAGATRSILARKAVRIDHIAIAVRDLEAAIVHFRDHYGFDVLERRAVSGAVSGMDSATLRAGGVTFVLCEGDSRRSNVSRYVENYGPGVQHVAIAVRDQSELLDDLFERGADLLTGIINAPGLDQSFTKREPNSGIQMEFVSRTDNDGFHDANVQELFMAMEREDVY
jgi:chorismate mutase-like protein